MRGQHALASLAPGWRFKRDRFELLVMAGVDYQTHYFTPDDLTNRSRGDRLGVRAGFDVWFEPQPNWMVNSSASLTSLNMQFDARIALGTRLLDVFWIGPEVATLGDDAYRQFRVGAHVTALKTGAIEWSAAAGFASDSDRRSGAYGRISVLTRR